MAKIKKEFLKKTLLILSTLILISAFVIQYIFSYQPCNLCLIERIPYALTIIILILNFLFKKDQMFYCILLLLIFAFSIIISFYHLGIEQGFFKESTSCVSQNTDLILKEDILNSFLELKVSCKDVAFSFLNLSLTTYNMIVSILMFFITIKIYLIINDTKK